MLPAKLKSNSLNQIDQSLENIRAANRISLSAHNLVIDGHIATAVLISLINEFRAVRCEVSPAEVAMAQQKSAQP